jgi:hypothetical protein
LEDCVGGEIDADEFWAAKCGLDDCARGILDSASVEDPETIFGVYDYALDTDEVVLIVCSGGRCGGVIDSLSLLSHKALEP